MHKYLVIGAGTIGTLVARNLAGKGYQVGIVSRHGSDPKLENVKAVALDAGNAQLVSDLAVGAHAIFNCANPLYHRWMTDWPPIADALLHAARSSGAVLVTLGNLYAYGKVDGPMTAAHPLDATYAKAQVRAKMWNDALYAHQQGQVRATEVRASDFIGPGAKSFVGTDMIQRILRGKKCWTVGALDLPHSWTYVADVAVALVAAAQSEHALCHAWHVPTNPPRSQRQVLCDLAERAGVPRPNVSSLPTPVLRAAGVFHPILRELPKTLYQFTNPFIMDDSATRKTFGLEPTPWSTVLDTTIDACRSA